jgi:polysaccharide biosynthesis protein PslE
MTPSTEPTSSPREFVRMLTRHRRKMVIFSGVVLALVAAFTLLTPRAYRSQAKLFVRLGRENVTLDPTATFGQAPVVAIPQSRENEINSVVEILRSRSLLDAVVDRVGPGALLGEGGLKEPDPARVEPDEKAPRVARTPQEDNARRKLARQLTVEAVKKSNVILISYDGPSPEVAEAVVACLVRLYLDQHGRLNRTPGAHKFLTEQTEQARAELLKAESRLRDLQAETGLFSPDAQKQIVVTRLGRLEDELLQAGAALAAAEAELAQLRAKLAALPETHVTARTTGVPNEATDNMRGQLYALELKELDLLSRHTEKHPEVQLIRQQVAAAREILDREQRAREQVTTGPNRVQEEARLAVLKQEPVVAALRARSESLRAQLEDERRGLKTLNAHGLRLAEQQRTVDLQSSLYRRHAENLAQTQTDRAMEAEKISNLSVAQPASFDAEPVRPRRMLNLIAGLVLALSGSLALAWLAESWDRPAIPAEPAAPSFREPALAVTTNGHASSQEDEQPVKP